MWLTKAGRFVEAEKAQIASPPISGWLLPGKPRFSSTEHLIPQEATPIVLHGSLKIPEGESRGFKAS